MLDKELLKEFKGRMHIFHDSEDENLSVMLKASIMAVKSMVGSDDVTRPDVKELVIERSRYAYNDSLEYFEDNFKSRILGVGFDVLSEGEADE